MEWNGMDWNGMEWNRMEWKMKVNEKERKGGKERNGVMDIRKGGTGYEWNGMEN